MRFENMLLITDIDGTLINDDKQILEKDKAAIREFTAHGGIFTIATGRGVALARPVAEELEIGAPAVLYNGAAVYDYKENRFLWQCTLPAGAADYVRLVSGRFPGLGIEILRGEDVYVTQTNKTEEDHLAGGVKNPIRRPFSEVPAGDWIKALFADEPKAIDRVIEFIGGQRFDGVHLTRTAPMYYEMLPLGANKGGGLRKLAALAEMGGRRIVAAGDYINDMEMLEYADFAVAVGNALDEVKAAADLTVCDNNSGAVWEIVEHLKKTV